MNKAHQGFSLVELMIALAIMAILLTAAAPEFATWMRNSRVRAAAEAVRDGLQLARGEAVRRNTSLRFQLTSSLDSGCALNAKATDGPVNWVVSADDPVGSCDADPLGEDAVLATATANAPRILQKRPAAEGSQSVRARASEDALIFNGLGRATVTAAGGVGTVTLRPSDDLECAKTRCLCVTVSVGGQVRLCDPKLDNDKDPQSCFDQQGTGVTRSCAL